jgi:hypothetical protein
MLGGRLEATDGCAEEVRVDRGGAGRTRHRSGPAVSLAPLTRMAVRPELRFRLPNSPGALARVTALLSAEQIRLLALSLESTGLVHLIVDNPSHAAAALSREHYSVEQHDVIYTLVAARSVGSILTAAAASGINIDYAYTSSPDADGMLALVLGVENAQRAAAAAGL